MITLSTAQAASHHSAEDVFARWADPQTWADWDPELSWVRFEGPVQVGARGRLKPASGPVMAWSVSVFEHNRVFTNVGSLPAARLEFEHRVSPADHGCEAVVTIRLHGAFARFWNRVMGAGLRNAGKSSLDGLISFLDRAA